MAPSWPMYKARVPSSTSRPSPTTSPTPSCILTILPCWPSRTYRSPAASMAMSMMSEKSLTPFSVLPAPTTTRPEAAPIGHCKTQHGSRPSMMKRAPLWTCTAHGSNSPSAAPIGRSAATVPPRMEQPKSAHQWVKACRSWGIRAPPGLPGVGLPGVPSRDGPVWLFKALAARRAMTTPGRPVRPSRLLSACRDATESSGKRTIWSSAAVESSRPGSERCQCITAESTSSSLSTRRSSLRSRPIILCNGHEPNCSVFTHALKFSRTYRSNISSSSSTRSTSQSTMSEEHSSGVMCSTRSSFNAA
mmetsp:Transcript_101282/g.315661  ORF Transcript_101282/g.315661 Transcript_101282/m.315661 type:complete len:304 (+) Transcript_101282:569-1480(+)